VSNEIQRIALALGFDPKEDFTLEEVTDRATFLRQLAESGYRKGEFDSADLDAACHGVAPEAVGRAVKAIALSVSRHATTEPGPPLSEPAA
jgi:hypothetical protein